MDLDLDYDLEKGRGEKKITENVVQNQILKFLATIPGGVRFQKRAASLAHKGEPDLYGSYQGVHFECELKAPGAKPTVLQTKKLDDWAKSGAVAFWTDNIGHFVQVFETIIVPLGNTLETIRRVGGVGSPSGPNENGAVVDKNGQ